MIAAVLVLAVAIAARKGIVVPPIVAISVAAIAVLVAMVPIVVAPPRM